MKRKLLKIISTALILGNLVSLSSINAKASTWRQNTSGWWYENDDGSYPTNQWKLINNSWYYFNSAGYMVTGWNVINGATYYFNSSGAMQTGWLTLDGGITYYYLLDSGIMATGWQTIGGTQYYFHPNGTMATYWQHIDGQWVYFASSGGYMGNPSKNGNYFANGTIKGIDVSVHQGNIDWNLVKSEGISFAMVRIGHGNRTLDSKYSVNMRGASSVGIATGVYFYSTALSEEQAILDAQFAIDNMRGYSVSYPVAIDLEDSRQAQLGKSKVTSIAKAFCDEISRAGYTPMIYCNNTWANNYVDLNQLPYIQRWIAQYNYYYDTTNWRNVWQASSKTVLKGITANTVDADFSYVNYAANIGTRTSSQSNYSKTTGLWKKDGIGWWYQFLSGGYPVNSWQLINGTWYYFNGSGYLVTGWLNLGGTWYYLDSSGAMVTGWRLISGTWYYFGASGAMQTGWQLINGTWYYMNGSGAMVTGWQLLGGTWYYMNGSGAMQTGWQVVNGTWYYFHGSGAMASNEWAGGYWLSASGAWNYRPIGSWHLNTVGWWYGDTSGWYARNTSQRIDGVTYRFNSRGYIY